MLAVTLRGLRLPVCFISNLKLTSRRTGKSGCQSAQSYFPSSWPIQWCSSDVGRSERLAKAKNGSHQELEQEQGQQDLSSCENSPSPEKMKVKDEIARKPPPQGSRSSRGWHRIQSIGLTAGLSLWRRFTGHSLKEAVEEAEYFQKKARKNLVETNETDKQAAGVAHKEWLLHQQMKESISEDFKMPNPTIATDSTDTDLVDKPPYSVDACIIVSKSMDEFNCVAAELKPLPGEEKVRRYKYNHPNTPLTFYVGAISATTGEKKSYCAALVQCGQGSTLKGSTPGSTITTSKCIDIWKPKFITTIGMAFGTPEHVVHGLQQISINEKLHVGDVLVSGELLPCDPERLSKDGTQTTGKPMACCYTPASISQHVDEFNRDETRKSFIIGHDNKKQRPPQAYFGHMLSSEKLFNNKDEHREAAEKYIAHGQVVIGGEMEGIGIFEMCYSADPPVKSLVIKGITDWGDGYKDNKMQPIAAQSAMQFFLYVLPDIASTCNFSALPEQNEQGSLNFWWR